MISIVIVNWNSGNQLKDCVDSIYLHGGSSVKKIVIVDNDSSDGSIDCLESDSKLTIIKNKENFGFGKACNIGASSCDTEFILFLNPDTKIMKDSINIPFSCIKKDSSIGVCGISLLDETGAVARSCARFPSPVQFLVHALGADKIFPSKAHFMLEWDHLNNRVVDQVIGAFFLTRKDLFNEIGGFDERFFVYYEEVDYSYRLMKLGFRSVYLSEAKAFHAGGGTSRNVKAKRLFYSLRSRFQYIKKNMNSVDRFFVILITFGLELFGRIIQSIIRMDFKSTKENILAYYWLTRWIVG